MVTQSRNSYVEADLHALTIEELSKQLEEDDGTYQSHMEGRLQNLLKESREKSKYWVSCSSSDNTELYYKKVCAHLHRGLALYFNEVSQIQHVHFYNYISLKNTQYKYLYRQETGTHSDDGESLWRLKRLHQLF